MLTGFSDGLPTHGKSTSQGLHGHTITLVTKSITRPRSFVCSEQRLAQQRDSLGFIQPLHMNPRTYSEKEQRTFHDGVRRDLLEKQFVSASHSGGLQRK